MKITFNVPSDTSHYVQLHNDFISVLIRELSVSDIDEICYYGQLADNVRKVNFSDYLARHGCVQIDRGFTGYFGFKSYKDTLQQFVLETATKYMNTPFAIILDVQANVNERPESDLAICANLLLSK